MKEPDGNDIEIGFVDPDDAKAVRRTRVERGASLLDAARAAGVAMDATCGARGRCRSCRCKILSGDVSPATMQDTLQLGHEEVRERFRLGCQTRPVTHCEVIALPPKSEAGHQILTGANPAGDGVTDAIDSGVTKHVVAASPPREEHRQTSDLAQVLEAMDSSVGRRVPLSAMRRIPGELRKQRGELTVTTFNGRIIDVEAGDTSEHTYGMAFDIGTTSIVGTLLHLETGEELAAVGSVNPQTIYGGDLMSRIAYAQFDEKKLVALRAKVLNAINGFVKEACRNAGVTREHVYKIVVVGNTCMHHIFLGVDVTFVGLAPYAPRGKRRHRRPRERASAQGGAERAGLPAADRRGLRRRGYHGVRARHPHLRERRAPRPRRHRHQRRGRHGLEGPADGVLRAGRAGARRGADPSRHAGCDGRRRSRDDRPRRPLRRHRFGSRDRHLRVAA